MMADFSSTRELITLTPQVSNLTDGDSDYEELPSPGPDGEETDDASHKGEQKIRAFNCFHDPSKAFKDPSHKMLIPGVPVKVKIIDVERSAATHLLNPNLYVLQLQHGPYEWVIKKRYKHFQHLHQQLLLFRTALSIPLPTKKHKERRKTCRTDRKRLPRFPRKPEALLPLDKILRRAEQLETYLNNVLKMPMYRNHHEMMNFLEICPFSFIHGLGMKYKEGVVQKRSGGHRGSVGCFRLKRTCIDWCGRWRWRWLIIKDTWIAYVNPKDGRVRCVLLMDQAFHVDCGFLATGIHHGLQVSNLTRHLLIRCFTYRRAREWLDSLMNASKDTGKDFTQPNKYDSFAPVRINSSCRWFVDGATYCEAVADALEQAKEEIFIADWWLSPELYMKRPVIQGEIWRLDYILQRKASQGVKVFILLYKEVELALGINSLYSKQQLVHMHPNIKVLRHPDHVTGGTLFWAHHEKIVCIDQTYAFLGGIDLCYGRWDDHQHRLTDLGGVGKTLGPDTIDLKTSSTPRGTPMLHRSHSTSDIRNDESIPNYKEWKFLRLSLLSQPPPPIQVPADTTDEVDGIEILVQSPTPQSSQVIPRINEPGDQGNSDHSKHLKIPLSQLNNTASSNGGMGMRKHISRKLRAKRVMQAVGHFQVLNRKMRNKSLDSLDSGWDSLDVPSTNLRRTASEVALSALGLEGEAKMWIGKDYINFIVKDFEHLHKPYQDLVDRHTTPRMPWHDIGAFVQGAVARDVARHFIQRWNFTKFEKAKYYDRYPWLLPKSYEGVENVLPLQLNTTNKLFCANCQVIRSVGTWSAGVKNVEQSIHTASLDVIKNAEHYVYIENQFFISQSSGHKDVYNGICDALYERIVRAHRSKSCFRVYVCMPLLPAFEGEIGTDTGTAIQAITHWNYASICRGSGSLWQRLALEVGDPSNYITFYGLRNHGTINDKLTTELVYVHSKLMIADDCVAIIGSANINDRSMLGDRDSEIAVIVTDVDFEQSVMNGKPFEAGRFAGSLRRTIFREHLGLFGSKGSSIDIRDPVKESFYKEVWIRTAALNTSVFEKVFRCIPSDEVRNFAQLRNFFSKPYMAITDPKASKELLATVRGHLVLLPLQFLCEESLTPATGTKESLMPVCLWT